MDIIARSNAQRPKIEVDRITKGYKRLTPAARSTLWCWLAFAVYQIQLLHRGRCRSWVSSTVECRCNLRSEECPVPALAVCSYWPRRMDVVLVVYGASSTVECRRNLFQVECPVLVALVVLKQTTDTPTGVRPKKQLENTYSRPFDSSGTVVKWWEELVYKLKNLILLFVWDARLCFARKICIKK